MNIRLWQGVFYVATGVWPLLHMASFEAITGKKQDKWLVQTVGALVTVIGGYMLAGDKRTVAPLGLSSALALAAVDLIYAGTGRIRKVYLLDAAAELAVAAMWIHELLSTSKKSESTQGTFAPASQSGTQL